MKEKKTVSFIFILNKIWNKFILLSFSCSLVTLVLDVNGHIDFGKSPMLSLPIDEFPVVRMIVR